MACVAYTGPDIPYLNIKAGHRMDEVIQKILQAVVDFSCADNAANECKSVYGIRISNLTANTLQLSWASPMPAPITFEVQYKKSSEADTAYVSLPATNKHFQTITDLLAATAYDFRIRTLCTDTPCTSIVVSITTLNNI